MARSVQISDNYSVKHGRNFLIFLIIFFSISQIKKFGELANMAKLPANQLTSYQIYTLLRPVVTLYS